MKNPIIILNGFIRGVAGLWINPETKNQYLFTPNVNNMSTGEVTVIQHGSQAEIPLTINLAMKGNSVVIFVEGTEYEVLLTELPLKTLNITLAPGKVIRLLKE